MPAPMKELLALVHGSPSHTKQIHALSITSGQAHNPSLLNSLLNAYAKCNISVYAHYVFNQMPTKDIISLTSLLTSLTLSNLPHQALRLFKSTFSRYKLTPDHFLYATLARACTALSSPRLARQVHARFLLSEHSTDDVVKSSLLDMYAKCGRLEEARQMFRQISRPNSIACTAMVSAFAKAGKLEEALDLFRDMNLTDPISWTALISGFVKSGDGFKALELFLEMRKGGVKLDPFSLSSVIGASANLAALEQGKQLHSLLVRSGFESSMVVGNALVDMYAKCGDVEASRVIFDGIRARDVVSWTTMLVGLAQHGRAREALDLFTEMRARGLKPNEVTFVGLLYACSHAGLVTEGIHYFDSMSRDHCLTPSLQHYTCMLDLYGRAGLLKEAEELIQSMPKEPDEAAWAALLSACKSHGEAQMGIKIAGHLLSLRPKDPSTYILLSNIYASARMWDEASKVRSLMSDIDAKKRPGFSWVEYGNKVHVFCAGDVKHPQKDEILGLLRELEVEMRKRGYVPDTSFVLLDLEHQEKEEQLSMHSERLAIACGLINGVKGVSIRVVKNLRVCGDCHIVIKLISEIVDREIVVRDANRFHHFREGKCSCGDFW
ncbi:hypothetical protein AMTRI_Chr13g84450 [Amborella trichopoda]